MDSGIELNEQDQSSAVVHRTTLRSEESGNDSAEILDQEQQQQIIDGLSKEYEQMVKTQRYSFIILTIIVSGVTIFASYSTGNHKVLLPAAASYFSLLLVELLLQSSGKLNKGYSLNKDNSGNNDKTDSNNSTLAEPSVFNSRNWWIWAITAAFEVFSIYSSNKYGVANGSLKKTPVIILHVGYFILFAFLFSLQRFSQSFPEEIKNLQKLKYGSKLA